MPQTTNSSNTAATPLGQIVLVVIGILIALQINNWNEYRKERLIENELPMTDSLKMMCYSIALPYVRLSHESTYENLNTIGFGIILMMLFLNKTRLSLKLKMNWPINNNAFMIRYI